MKSTAVDESLSSMNQQFCSRENQLLQMWQQNEKSTQKKSQATASGKTLHIPVGNLVLLRDHPEGQKKYRTNISLRG